jgi:hypothetical protein
MGENVIVIKTVYTDDIRRFRITPNNFNYAQLVDIFQQIYKDSFNQKVIKYQDDEGDLITVANDTDLREAFNWSLEQIRKNPKLNPLRLIIMDMKEKQEENDVVSPRLLGITDITQMFQKLSINGEENMEEDTTLVMDGLMRGTQWKGIAYYMDGDKTTESFPFTINITMIKDNVVEGNIIWESLDSCTLFLGEIKNKNTFIFREYEAVYGEDNIELPNNYKGILEKNQIKGSIINQKNAFFQVSFVGIYSNDDGMLALPNIIPLPYNPKRKYNLENLNNSDTPTLNDKIKTFKKLTEGAPSWYDKTPNTNEKLEPRKKARKAKYAESCNGCGLPLYEKYLTPQSTKKVKVCANYPRCKVNDDSSEDYSY